MNLTEYMLSTLTQLGYKAVTVGDCLGDPAANWYRAADGAGSGNPVCTPFCWSELQTPLVRTIQVPTFHICACVGFGCANLIAERRKETSSDDSQSSDEVNSTSTGDSGSHDAATSEKETAGPDAETGSSSNWSTVGTFPLLALVLFVSFASV